MFLFVLSITNILCDVFKQKLYLYRSISRTRRKYSCIFSKETGQGVPTKECASFLSRYPNFCILYLNKPLPRGRILGRYPDKSLNSFLPCYHSHLYSFAFRFLFLQTQAASYSFYSALLYSTHHTPSLWFKKFYRNLKSENSQYYAQKQREIARSWIRLQDLPGTPNFMDRLRNAQWRFE